MKPKVLFEDEYILAVSKPYGLLSEGEGRDSLPMMLRDYRREKGENGEIYPVHRLDRTTRGVIVYAKTSDCAKKLSELIRAGEMSKYYLAKIEGVPAYQSGVFEDYLFYDRRKNKTFVVKRERKGVRRAKLSYEVLSAENIEGLAVSTVRVELFTGRTHQIRAQFAYRKMPVVGDRRYGSKIKSFIELYSDEIKFVHPYTGEDLVIHNSKT